jgi:WD40 repeat protein/serine/threonine protein kinase
VSGERDSQIAALSIRAARRVDETCDRFEEELQAGQSPAIEGYLGNVDTQAQAALLRQLVLLEWEYRQNGGDSIELTDYLARFPQHAALMRDASREHSAATGRPLASPACPVGAAAYREWEQLGYQLLAPLGQGGMGTVYLAYQPSAERLVALKALSHALDGPEDFERFRREAQTLAAIEHPHIVAVYGAGEHHGRPFYGMEYCPGGSLADRLRRSHLHPLEAAALVKTLARAIHAAHQAGIVHRDLKPSNVLLSDADCESRLAESGSSSETIRGWRSEIRNPKLADFGLAKEVDATVQTQSGALLGTPQYMAPEQARGDVGQIGVATDVYGLGALLYECLTGRPPFCAATILQTVLEVIANDAPPPTRFEPGIPRGLETICLKCLNKAPALRYENAAALADDLERFERGEPIRARRVSAAKRTWHGLMRRPVAASLLAATMAAIAISLPLTRWALGERKGAVAAQRDIRLQAIRNRYERALSVEEEEGSSGVVVRLSECLRDAVQAEAFALEESIRRQLDAWSSDFRRRPKIFAGHEKTVFAVDYNSDGTKILTGSEDGTAQIWNEQTGEPIGRPLRHADTVFAVAFSPDGRHVLTGSADGTAQRWLVATSEPDGPPLKHQDRVLAVAFSPDGTKILTASHDQTAKLWNASTGEPLHSLTHPGIVRAVAFSPDGNTILTGCDDATARTWATATGTPLGWQVRHRDRVFAVAFSGDGKIVLTGSQDKTAQLWDAATGSRIGPSVVHLETVFAVDFSSDGSSFLTASDDGTVRLWDTATGRALGRLEHRDRVRAAVFNPDGTRVLTGSWDHVARQWTLEGPALIKQGSEVHAVAFSPDGASVVTGSGDGTARLWDRRGAPIGKIMQHAAFVTAVAFSPDGRFVLTASGDGTARLWDARTGEPVGTPATHQSAIWRIGFVSDGRRFVTASKDGTARLWDTASCQPQYPPLDHHCPVFTLAVSPDSKTFLTGDIKSFARLWNAETGESLGTPFEHNRGVSAAAFSPDGTKVLTGSWDLTAQLWDLATGQRVGQALQHQGPIVAVAFSPDGNLIATASADKTAQLWDAADCRLLCPPLRHEGGVTTAAFSADGKMLLTTSEDGMARLWDTSTGTRLGPVLLHKREVTDGVFSHNGESILTGSRDGIARLWETPGPLAGEPERIIAWTQAATGMQLNGRGGLQAIDSPSLKELRQRLADPDGLP